MPETGRRSRALRMALSHSLLRRFPNSLIFFAASLSSIHTPARCLVTPEVHAARDHECGNCRHDDYSYHIGRISPERLPVQRLKYCQRFRTHHYRCMPRRFDRGARRCETHRFGCLILGLIEFPHRPRA